MVDLEHCQIQDNLGFKPKAALSRCLVETTCRAQGIDFSIKGACDSKYKNMFKRSLNIIYVH